MQPHFIHLRMHTEYSLKDGLEAGIKPIIGVDVWVAKSATSKQAYRLTLLCQNNEGYRNLVKLISRSYVEGQKTNHPVIQKSWLATYSPGLIALSGAKEGDIGVALLSQNNTQAKECLQYWQTIFPSRKHSLACVLFCDSKATHKPKNAYSIGKLFFHPVFISK